MGLDDGMRSLLRLSFGVIKGLVKLAVVTMRFVFNGVKKGMQHFSKKSSGEPSSSSQGSKIQNNKYSPERYQIVVSEKPKHEQLEADILWLDKAYSKSEAIKKCCQLIKREKGYVYGEVIEKNSGEVVYSAETVEIPTERKSVLDKIQSKGIFTDKEVSQDTLARKGELEQ